MAELRTRRVAVLFLLAVVVSAANADDEPVIDIGPGVTPPRVVHQVNPSYKPDDEGFRISGTVIVGLTVSSKGEPKNVHVVKSLDKTVDQSAVEAVQQWEFEPAQRDGKPVAVRITVEIRFRSL